jgi:hypothetical protein
MAKVPTDRGYSDLGSVQNEIQGRNLSPRRRRFPLRHQFRSSSVLADIMQIRFVIHKTPRLTLSVRVILLVNRIL